MVCMRLATLYSAAQACGLPRSIQSESESYQHSPRHPLEVREARKNESRQWTSLPVTSCQRCCTAPAGRGQIALQKYLPRGEHLSNELKRKSMLNM